MYGSDFGRAERSYYTPRDYYEGEREATSYVYCSNEDCADFDAELEVDILYSTSGLSGWGEWKCPTCGTDYTHEREFDEYEGFDPDAREGK